MAITNWKLSPDGASASRTLDNGATESRLVSAIDPAELTKALPAYTAAEALLVAKNDQILALETSYAAAIQIPVAYMGATFQADIASQDTLTKSLVAGSVPAGFYWLDSLNAKVPMTFTQLQGLAGAMLAQGQAAFDRLQTRKATVRNATAVAAVQAVIW